ncbi:MULTISPECIES: hypothetical protein [unclassified Pseudomonas]|uniref:hypothetical protein n=1 Tax=unclassified Pseudomonas TaxID=196821 RepID=UPI00099705EA|nr:hypothetical protein [Pseudomonas sp. MF4836]OOV96153.1 hypothetical protein MF4836_12960 [Pseudomonas sp. MF4836]
MNDKQLFEGSNSGLNRRPGHNLWLAPKPVQVAGGVVQSTVELKAGEGKCLRLLKRLAWAGLAVALLTGLLSWGINSRFGLLLLLLLR